MANGSLARRYARALLSLGVDKGCIDQLGADLDTFAEVLDQDDGRLRGILNNPGLTTTERKNVVVAVLKLMSIHQLSQNFINLLVDKSRLAVFDDIRRAYTDMADELAGRVRATVTTATPADFITAGQIQKVLEGSTGKTVLIDFQVDPDLIGGIVAKVGDTVYDASIRARLQNLRETLSR
ncbi:MAG: F-type H+-transporting ATPase subunit delta [Myxococcota bacterium]|jgi:F-type H+-transporting ATPase subunit delta